LFEVLEELNVSDRMPVKRAGPDRRIVQIQPASLAHGHSAEIWTLSPSDAQIRAFYAEIGQLRPELQETKARLPSQKRNLLSVVTLRCCVPTWRKQQILRPDGLPLWSPLVVQGLCRRFSKYHIMDQKMVTLREFGLRCWIRSRFQSPHRITAGESLFLPRATRREFRGFRLISMSLLHR
jgi:hypothetical protein